jgi:hypothetical protein
MSTINVPQSNALVGDSNTYKVEDLYELQYSRSLYLRITAKKLGSNLKYALLSSSFDLRQRFCRNDNPLSRIRAKLGNLLGEII